MKPDDFNGFLVMLLPIVAVLVMGAAGIIWIVMSQRTKRQAIAAGLDGEQYQGLGARWFLLQIGVFLFGLGLALFLIGIFKLDDGGALAWGLILLCSGGALMVNHQLSLRSRKARP